MAFAKFDTNGDDRLDYREFCEMIRRKAEEENAGKAQGQKRWTEHQEIGEWITENISHCFQYQ